MKLRRRFYSISLAAVISAISVLSSGQPSQNRLAPDCNLDEIKKQLKTAREDEAHLKSLSEAADKELKNLDNSLQGTITEVGNEISAGVGGSKFAAARKKYDEMTAAYDQALSKYHEQTSNGVDDEKAKTDTQLTSAAAGRTKARDEMLNLVKEYQDHWKQLEDATEKETGGKKKLDDLPGTPKTESKLERLKRLVSEFEATEHQADESGDELAGWAAEFRAKQRKREGLENKLREAEAKCAPSKRLGVNETKGTVDSCLVGTWRSESIVGPAGQRGGSGIVMTIKADGTITIDYNEMQSLEAEKGGTVGPARYDNWWRGTASGHITTRDGTTTIVNVGKSELTHKLTVQGRTTTNPLGKLGPALPTGYNCDQATLKWTSAGNAFTFKREEKAR